MIRHKEQMQCMSCLMSLSIHCLFSLSPKFILPSKAFLHCSIKKGTSSSHFLSSLFHLYRLHSIFIYFSLLHVFRRFIMTSAKGSAENVLLLFLRRSKHQGNINVSCRVQPMLLKHTKLDVHLSNLFIS